jgi:hypothetical protein
VADYRLALDDVATGALSKTATIEFIKSMIID